jgi:hypothetical protein
MGDRKKIIDEIGGENLMFRFRMDNGPDYKW